MMGRQKKDPRAAYLKQVKKCLSCPSWEKERLMSGLENEIDEAFPSGAMSLDEIVACFGLPFEAAQELEEVLPSEKLIQYSAQNRRLTCLAVISAVVIIAAAIGVVGYLFVIGMFNTHYIVTDINYN